MSPPSFCSYSNCHISSWSQIARNQLSSFYGSARQGFENIIATVILQMITSCFLGQTLMESPEAGDLNCHLKTDKSDHCYKASKLLTFSRIPDSFPWLVDPALPSVRMKVKYKFRNNFAVRCAKERRESHGRR